MYLHDQAMAYPFGLHISWATDIKMVADRVCLCLLVWDATKKMGFELYYKEEMPTRKMNMGLVNFPCNWSPLFHGKHMIRTPNAHDARTSWSQIMWIDSLKASTFGYDGSNNVMHHNVLHVLRPSRKYHFNDTCVYFTKDNDGYFFIQHLLKLPIIWYEGTYNLKKMKEA